MPDSGELVKPPVEPSKASDAVSQTAMVESTSLAANSGAKDSSNEEKEISDYLKEILRVSRERFFDSDQATTLAKEGYEWL